MEKKLRTGEHNPKKQRILRPLHEFLEEQQEPFLLEDYLLDRQYSSKRIHACPNGDLSSEGLPILGFQSRAQNLRIRDSYERNEAEHSRWRYACGLLEMNHRNKKKRRRVSRGKIRAANLYFLRYSEEYHMENLHVDVKRLKFTVQESKTREMVQVESKRGHGMQDEGASIAKTKESPIQYMKIFSFKKVKKMDKTERRKKSEAEKSVKCFWFKSIIKKLIPTKVSLLAIHTGGECVSKKLSDTKTKLCWGVSENKLCKYNQIQHQVSDIVSWDSFKGHDKMNDFHEKNCSSDEALHQDYIYSSTPIPKSSRIFEISGHEENPKRFSGSVRNVNLVVGEMNRKSQEREGERNVSSADDLGEKNRDVYCQEKNLPYAVANGCSDESKQLSPVSVLEMSSDEEPSALEPTDACSPMTEHRFLQRYNEGGQHSWKDSSTSEQRAQREVSYESGNGSFSYLSQDNIHGSRVHNFNQISSHASSSQFQVEMDWEHGETEEYVRKVLSSPDTMLCLMGLNDSEIQDLTCFSPPDREGSLPAQCSKRKEIPICGRKLLFDCVKEILQSPKKHYGSEVLKEPWLKECFVSEHLAKVICSRIYSWMETDTNITERMVELTWKKEGEDWTKFRVEAEEIGIEIEAHVFGQLIEELVDDLSHLQP